MQCSKFVCASFEHFWSLSLIQLMYLKLCEFVAIRTVWIQWPFCYAKMVELFPVKCLVHSLNLMYSLEDVHFISKPKL